MTSLLGYYVGDLIEADSGFVQDSDQPVGRETRAERRKAAGGEDVTYHSL